jgi:hypothetical protein
VIFNSFDRADEFGSYKELLYSLPQLVLKPGVDGHGIHRQQNRSLT